MPWWPRNIMDDSMMLGVARSHFILDQPLIHSQLLHKPHGLLVSHYFRSAFQKWGPIVANGHWRMLRARSNDKLAVVSMEDQAAPMPNRRILIFTVSIDSFIDGFLIGLCIVSDHTTGSIMAFSTSLEMGFLGLAYGSVLRGDSGGLTTLALAGQLALPPTIMVFAAWLGASLGTGLEKNSVLFLAMLSFSTVALLSLVTQELLVEARENVKDPLESNLTVALLFVGLFLAFLMSTASG